MFGNWADGVTGCICSGLAGLERIFDEQGNHIAWGDSPGGLDCGLLHEAAGGTRVPVPSQVVGVLVAEGPLEHFGHVVAIPDWPGGRQVMACELLPFSEPMNVFQVSWTATAVDTVEWQEPLFP